MESVGCIGDQTSDDLFLPTISSFNIDISWLRNAPLFAKTLETIDLSIEVDAKVDCLRTYKSNINNALSEYKKRGSACAINVWGSYADFLSEIEIVYYLLPFMLLPSKIPDVQKVVNSLIALLNKIMTQQTSTDSESILIKSVNSIVQKVSKCEYVTESYGNYSIMSLEHARILRVIQDLVDCDTISALFASTATLCYPSAPYHALHVETWSLIVEFCLNASYCHVHLVLDAIKGHETTFNSQISSSLNIIRECLRMFLSLIVDMPIEYGSRVDCRLLEDVANFGMKLISTHDVDKDTFLQISLASVKWYLRSCNYQKDGLSSFVCQVVSVTRQLYNFGNETPVDGMLRNISSDGIIPIFKAVIVSFPGYFLFYEFIAIDSIQVRPFYILGDMLMQIWRVSIDISHQMPIMQSIESWVNCVKKFLGSSASLDTYPDILDSINRIADLALYILVSRWNLSIKSSHSLFLAMFECCIDLKQKIVMINPTYASKDYWMSLFNEIMQVGVENKCKYEGLCILVPIIGSDKVIERFPNMHKILLSSFEADDNIWASVTALFSSLIGSNAPLACSWKEVVLKYLIHPSYKTRLRVYDHVLPVLIKHDSGCITSFMRDIDGIKDRVDLVALQTNYADRSDQTNIGWDSMILMSKLSLGMIGRSKGVVGDDLFESAGSVIGGLSLDDISAACVHFLPCVRVAALSVVSYSHKTAQRLSVVEIDILMRSLPYCLKLSGVDDKQRLNRVIKRLMMRVHESVVACDKVWSKLQGKKARPNPELEMDVSNYMTLINSFCKQFEVELLKSLYPGSPFEREIVGLEMLTDFVVCLKSTQAVCSREFVASAASANDLMSTVFSSKLCYALINILSSSWDPCRDMALDLLKKFPLTEVLGSHQSVLDSIHRKGMELSGSPRVRENDAGRSLFSLYCNASNCEMDSVVAQLIAEFLKRAKSLVFQLHAITKCQAVDVDYPYHIQHLANFEPSDDADADNSDFTDLLPHGLLSILQNLLLDDSLCISNRTRVIGNIISEVRKALALAIQVVGAVVTDDAEDEEVTMIAFYETGAVPNPNSNMQVKVDCRGCIYSENDAQSKDETTQRLIMGAWLLFREGCSLLSSLIVSLPLPIDGTSSVDLLVAEQDLDYSKPDDFARFISDGAIERSGCLSAGVIASVGNDLLLFLLRLKHLGAINAASDSLCTLCQYLFNNGSNNRLLCRLPFHWTKSLLWKLEASTQKFALRRSAGFAVAFVCLLRSEPFRATSVLMPLAMASLMKFATSCESQSEADNIRNRVHSLNIIRAIVRDAILCVGLAPYVSRLFEISVLGFLESEWSLRNSSVLLFSSLVVMTTNSRRLTDDFAAILSNFLEICLQSGKPFSSNLSASKVDFNKLFSSNSGLFEFIIGELSKHVDSESDVTSIGTKYPLLFLISCFCNQCLGELNRKDCDDLLSCASLDSVINYLAQSEWASSASKTQCLELMRVILLCRNSKSEKVRFMASIAFSSISPSFALPALIIHLLNDLRHNPSSNFIHGNLLFIDKLVEVILNSSKRSIFADNVFSGIVSVLLGPTLNIVRAKLPLIKLVYFGILEKLVLSCYNSDTNGMPDLFNCLGQQYQIALNQSIAASSERNWSVLCQVGMSLLSQKSARFVTVCTICRLSGKTNWGPILAECHDFELVDHIFEMLRCNNTMTQQGCLEGLSICVNDLAQINNPLLFKALADCLFSLLDESLRLIVMELLCWLTIDLDIWSHETSRLWDYCYNLLNIDGEYEDGSLPLGCEIIGSCIRICGNLVHVAERNDLLWEQVDCFMMLVLVHSLDDNCPSALRRACVCAVRNASLAKIQLRFIKSTCLYMLMQDDDEDVRNEAFKYCCLNYLSRSSVDCESTLIIELFTNWFHQEFANINETQCLTNHLSQLILDKLKSLTNVSLMLLEASKNKKTIFVPGKPCIFTEFVCIGKFLSRFVRYFPSNDLALPLMHWTCDQLDCLNTAASMQLEWIGGIIYHPSLYQILVTIGSLCRSCSEIQSNDGLDGLRQMNMTKLNFLMQTMPNDQRPLEFSS